MSQDKLLTTAEVARKLGVGPGTVRNYANAGQLRCVRLPSGRRRFRLADVEAILAEPQPSSAA